MMILLKLIAAIVLAAGTVSSNSNPALHKVRSLMDKIKNVAQPARSPLNGKTIPIKEEEINAYLADLVEQKGKNQIQSVKITLLGDKLLAVQALARVEWKEVFKADGDSVTAKLLSKAGGMGSAIAAQVQTGSAKGKGYLHVQSLKINGVTVPESLVSQLLRYLGENQRPPIDFSRLFPLPYGIQKIEVQKGALAVHF